MSPLPGAAAELPPDPTSRPDLPTRPLVPTRTTMLDRRETSRDAARDPRHPDPRTEPRRPRGHGLNSCPPQQ
ncbi:hypothetical protein C4D60_Mb04t05930 [Musa balbisiana]|uniref:Uncharacterized protein n=1 Tax=Musa balbisiana TaxID=52838 RepID=A0A4S8K9Y4_MUSBA|nr:hypothetical protein C4D60_Mb04t05930 [Musa balbisiana]